MFSNVYNLICTDNIKIHRQQFGTKKKLVQRLSNLTVKIENKNISLSGFSSINSIFTQWKCSESHTENIHNRQETSS